MNEYLILIMIFVLFFGLIYIVYDTYKTTESLKK